MRRSNWTCLAVLAIGALVVTACSSVPEDRAVEQELESLERNGSRVLLRDLADFSWETVFIFGPYEDGSTINKTVGGRVMAGGARVDEFENILVFVQGGKPVRQARVRDMFEWGTRNEWPANVEIVPTPYCRLVLVMPDDPDPPAECYR